MLANEPREILGEIRKYMFIHDITQDDLAFLMNKSKQTISCLFKTANPTLENLFSVLDALNLELDYCFVEKELIASKKAENDYTHEEEHELYYE